MTELWPIWLHHWIVNFATDRLLFSGGQWSVLKEWSPSGPNAPVCSFSVMGLEKEYFWKVTYWNQMTLSSLGVGPRLGQGSALKKRTQLQTPIIYKWIPSGTGFSSEKRNPTPNNYHLETASSILSQRLTSWRWQVMWSSLPKDILQFGGLVPYNVEVSSCFIICLLQSLKIEGLC